MSHNYFDPLVGGAVVDASSVNDIAEALDSAISGIKNGGEGIQMLSLGDPEVTTLSSNSFPRGTSSRHRLDTEGLAGVDQLDTATGGIEGDILVLQSSASNRVITIAHGTGANQFQNKTRGPVVLDDPEVHVMYMFSSGAWRELGMFRLSLGSGTGVSVASGSITIPAGQQTVIVDTEGGSTSDFLDTITAGYDGQVVKLRLNNSNRKVWVRHSAGNILLAGYMPFLLDYEYRYLELIWINSLSRWVQTNVDFTMKATTVPSVSTVLGEFSEMPVAYQMGYKNRIEIRGGSAAFQSMGVAAVTASGTLSAANQTDGTYTNALSGAVAGNTCGWITTTFNILRKQHNPEFIFVVRTGGAADLGNIKIWCGLVGAALANSDTFATSFLGFRFSTTADTGFTPYISDGASQSAGSVIGGGAIAVNTKYILSVKVDNANAIMRFRLNFDPATEQILQNNLLPVMTTDLGIVCWGMTTAALGKNVLFGRFSCILD